MLSFFVMPTILTAERGERVYHEEVTSKILTVSSDEGLIRSMFLDRRS